MADAPKPAEEPKKPEETNQKEQPGPKVLILGGGGFIGRNIVKYIVENKVSTTDLYV
jgi:hypothetical protein